MNRLIIININKNIMNNIIKKLPERRQGSAVSALCVISAVMLLWAGMLPSCNNKPPPEIKWDHLRGTQFKLNYLCCDISGGSSKPVILAPQDCDTCFTLIFDAEKKWEISGVSILNTLNIQFSRNTSTAIMNIFVSDMDEPFDGNLYCSLIRSVTGISSDGQNVLVLHINNKEKTGENSYTLNYKRITP